MRRLMLLLGLLAAMMLVGSPVLAHQGGPHHGNKYSKNYYPNGYFKYCEPDGAKYYGKKKISNNNLCGQNYSQYKTKWINGKKYYYVHVYYWWETPDRTTQMWDDWYYCKYHKYDSADSPKPNFEAWVTYKPTGNHYWESFFYKKLQF
jgi:hypothetical protein